MGRNATRASACLLLPIMASKPEWPRSRRLVRYTDYGGGQRDALRLGHLKDRSIIDLLRFDVAADRELGHRAHRGDEVTGETKVLAVWSAASGNSSRSIPRRDRREPCGDLGRGPAG